MLPPRAAAEVDILGMAEIHPNAEQEIAELEQVLAQKRAVLEQQKEAGAVEEMPHPKEILREAIREKIAKTPGSSSVPTSSQSMPSPPSTTPSDQQSYWSDELRPKVEELVKIAFSKSLQEAIRLAKAAENAALLDAFHDLIVDELYTHLVEQGKLQVIS